MMDTNPRAVIGANGGPPLPYDPAVLADCARDADEFIVAAGQWLDLGEIRNVEQAQRATDFVSGARKVSKRIDEARKAAKAPHDAAGKAVQEAFAPLLAKIERAVDGVKAMQAKWLRAEAARERDRKAKEAEEAAAARAEADRLAAEAAARNDVSGIVEAEAARKAADKLAKEAARPVSVSAGSATGGGRTMALRSVPRCEIESMGRALQHFRNHPDVAALLVRLAEAEVRAQKGAKEPPPGFTLRFEETAA